MIEIEYHWIVLAAMSAGLASVHLWFPWFDVRYARQEPFWMGLIGGIATGYVILYMLPKLGRMTAQIAGLDPQSEMAFLDLRMYFLMLSAMVSYLIMLHLDTRETRWSYLARSFDYFVHGAYSLLVGYVFVEMESGNLWVRLVICLILGLHLTGMNHVLRQIRTTGFDSAARWVYFLLVMLGAFLGLTTELPKVFINCTTAYLAGIIIVFVVSEELPLKYQDRVPWFLVGVTLFIIALFMIIKLDPRPGLLSPAY